MKKLILCAAFAILAGCGEREPAPPANDDLAMDANATDANMVTPAAFQINETTWEFTLDGKAQTESIDASGNYVTWSGSEHIDHGTAVMKEGKACFTSAMDQEGETCWTTSPTEIGQSMESTSDKGEKLTVKRVAYTPVPDAVKPPQ